jgi:hypothetical protein
MVASRSGVAHEYPAFSQQYVIIIVVNGVTSRSDPNHIVLLIFGDNEEVGFRNVRRICVDQICPREATMTLPLQLTFRNMKHSAEVEDWVRSEAAKLETFYHRILGCRVAIEVPHRHHRKGLHVRIDLTLPGKEIVVKREPVAYGRKLPVEAISTSRRTHAKSSNAELELAIHDAFKSAGRRVQDFARRQRGDVKRHQGVSLEA